MKPISVVQDTKYPEMYRLKWEDGVLSEDFYNITWAKNNLRFFTKETERPSIIDEHEFSESFVEARSQLKRDSRGRFVKSI